MELISSSEIDPANFIHLDCLGQRTVKESMVVARKNSPFDAVLDRILTIPGGGSGSSSGSGTSSCRSRVVGDEGLTSSSSSEEGISKR